MPVNMLSAFGSGGSQKQGGPLRLIVLTQLSSCSVERMFSKLEGIRKVCGENLYDDMAEVRLLLRCNGDLEPLVNKLNKFKL